MKKLSTLMLTTMLTVVPVSTVVSAEENTETQNTEVKTKELKTVEKEDVKDEKAQMPFDIQGQTGVSIDARTGEVYYDKGAHEKSYPASVTKIVTAILLDENVKDGEMMEASAFAVGQEASNFHFKLEEGEKISKEDAMYALLLLSANDVAVTIAEHIAGSQEKFAKMMTDRVKELGLTDTHFKTANGLHDPDHYTTPYDMAMVGREILLNHPNVLKAMGTSEKVISTTKKKDVAIKNPSKIHDNPLLLGGKTGFTNAAQNTLIEISEKDGKQVVSVTMKSTLAEEYNDVISMADYAFENMENYTLYKKENEVVKKIEINDQELDMVLNKDFYVKGKNKDEIKKAKEKIIEKEDLNEVKKGDEIGRIEVTLKGKKIGEEKLYAGNNIKKDENKKTHEKKDKEEQEGFNFGGFILSIVIPFLIYGTWQYTTNRNTKRKK